MRRIILDAVVQKTVIILPALCLLVAGSAAAQSGGPYVLDWSTIDGGGTSSGGTYVLTGTIGQLDAAYSAGGKYELLGGFWPGGPLCFVDFYSFAKFAEQWLYTGEGLAADLHEDNIVDLLDLKLFVDEWLEYCPYDWALK